MLIFSNLLVGLVGEMRSCDENAELPVPQSGNQARNDLHAEPFGRLVALGLGPRLQDDLVTDHRTGKQMRWTDDERGKFNLIY